MKHPNQSNPYESISKNSIDVLLTENEKERLYRFLISISPNARENPIKLENLIKKLGWSILYGHNYPGNQQLNQDSTESSVIMEMISWISIERSLSITSLLKEYVRPILTDGTELQRQVVVTLLWDSNVYLLKWKKHVMKLYFTFGKEEILAYHHFQNQLAQIEYDFDYEGKIGELNFNKVHIHIISLPKEGIIWTDFSSIACIPFYPGSELRAELSKESPLLVKIMNNIKEKNRLDNFPKTIHPMNIKFNGIVEGVLNLTITDIWDSIWEILEGQGFYNKFARKSPKLIHKISSMVERMKFSS
jgi:hypothetical protein